MEQLDLRGLLCRLDAPSVVPPSMVRGCKTYREAVQLCWEMRKVRNMTKAMLAERAGLYAPHVTQYLSHKDTNNVRDLPGWGVRGFEWACNNTAISQWHGLNAHLTTTQELELLKAEQQSSELQMLRRRVAELERAA